MIHYQLRCGAEHEFDGWFADSGSFEKQAAGGLLECPVCGTTQVDRALMAPAVPKKGRPQRKTRKPEPPAPEKGVSAPVAVSGERMPDHVRAMLQRLRAEVERNCDYVGDAFAEEARRLHRLAREGEEPPGRGIYGETTPEEAEALAEEGIEVARIPWVNRADG
jgi:hypothetical protein